MLKTKDIITDERYLQEWLKDIKSSDSHDAKVMDMVRTLGGNCKTLEDVLLVLARYEELIPYMRTAEYLTDDVWSFIRYQKLTS